MQNIAIVSTNKNKYSETFIHNHLRLLPFKIHYLFGGYLPEFYTTEGINGTERPFLKKAIKKPLPFWKGFLKNTKPTPILKKPKKEALQAAIQAYFLKNKIQAVLAEYGPSGVEMMDICINTSVPLVVHFHGYDAYRADMMRDFGKHYAEMFEKAALIIGVSKHMCQQLENLGCPTHKLRYNPYGPDVRFFNYTDAGKNPPHLLAVGRFAETKSPHLTILAFEKVKKAVPEARLIMVGDGHLLQACQLLAQALKLEDAIDFKGVLNHEAVGQLMQKTRAFVQHSITTPTNDTEGTPVSIIEACGSGLPVVSTLHAGIPDVVIEGESGFLVAEGDIDGMANQMIRLLQTPSLATEMGKKGFERINTHFTLQGHIERLAEMVREVI